MECASQVILTAQASGGCKCSPHVGELVNFVEAVAKTGPFDDALTRRIACAVGASGTVNFHVALPGESPLPLVHAASCLVRDSVHASTSAFNTCCMSYGLALAAQGIHGGSHGIATSFWDYACLVADFFSKSATDFALAGCLLPMAVAIVADPALTADTLARECQLSSDLRSVIRARHVVATMMSLWFAVVPNSDTRVQAYSLAAWLRWLEIALQGHEGAQFLLSQFGIDMQEHSNAVLQRHCARFTVLRSLHPKRNAKDTDSTPANVLRAADPVTIAEGIALSSVVLRHAPEYHVTQLASFASHMAFDALNLTRWAHSPDGFPLPESVARGLQGGGGVLLVPFLAEQVESVLSHNLSSLVERVGQLFGALVAPHRKGHGDT